MADSLRRAQQSLVSNADSRSNADLPLLLVVNHTRGEKVMMSPWDDMVSLEVLYGIAKVMKWTIGKDDDNITIGTREAFDECDYALYDKQGNMIYMPDSPDAVDDEDEEDDDEDTEESSELSDEEEDDDDDADEMADTLKNLKVGQKRTSDEAAIDYEFEEVDA